MEDSNFQRLFCGIQTYDWGMKGEDPLCQVFQIYEKAHFQYRYKDNRNMLKKSDNYAEIWMGTHPNLPSQNDQGKPMTEKLKFLFKVLSIAQPLSIQIHPNKAQAQVLHKSQPKLYPDSNHKPEMAIALSHFEALIGLAPKDEIIKNFQRQFFINQEFFFGRNPKIIYYIGEGQWNSFKNSGDPDDKETLQRIIGTILNWPDQILLEVLEQYNWPVKCCPSLLEAYGNIKDMDLGYIFALIMNHVTLKPGDAFLINPGQIHAYLYGNIIEVMANSDNVIRCGFTKKPRDTKAMIEIIETNMSDFNKVDPIIVRKKGYLQKQYATNYEEFLCISHQVDRGVKSDIFPIMKNAIIICLLGQGPNISYLKRGMCNDNERNEFVNRIV
ncbi:hypothetical protein pb186bvf_005938 [Paramecium bursaria]